MKCTLNTVLDGFYEDTKEAYILPSDLAERLIAYLKDGDLGGTRHQGMLNEARALLAELCGGIDDDRR